MLRVVACQTSDRRVTSPAAVGTSVRAQEARPIHVATVAELYAAVNDLDHAGRRIVLAPGTYFLDPAQTNGGRLEFQQDMRIVGERGDADAVVIDASNLPPASYSLGAFNTAPIRMGRGSNALEWLTIQNAHSPAVAAVETDLLGPGAAVIRVAYIVAQGTRRGSTSETWVRRSTVMCCEQFSSTTYFEITPTPASASLTPKVSAMRPFV
jgi:hypothetical protein